MTGSGLTALVAERSATVLALVVPVSELFCGFGSFVELPTVTVSEIKVPSVVFTFTFTTSLNVAVAPDPNAELLQLAVPPPPTGGAPQLKAGPLVWASETKVVFAGIWSLIQAPWAPLGPALAMVRV